MLAGGPTWRGPAGVQNAARLIEEVLTMDNVLLYWRYLFERYAALQNFRPALHPDAIPLDASVAKGAQCVTCTLYRHPLAEWEIVFAEPCANVDPPCAH